MKGKFICALAFFSMLSFSSYALSATQSTPATKDGEAIAWIAAIDNFEINAAEVASTKKINNEVKDYSSMLFNDHNQNLQQTMALSNQIRERPVETKALNKFRIDGRNQLKKLDKQARNFQKVFIDTMIAGHTDALNKVDHDLMDNVSNSDLKNLLQDTRNMIAHHLETAKEIQKNMQTMS